MLTFLLLVLMLLASLLLLSPTAYIYWRPSDADISAAGVNVAGVPAITDVDRGIHNIAGDQNETQQTNRQLLTEQ